MKKILFLTIILFAFSSCDIIDIKNDKGSTTVGAPEVDGNETGSIKINPESVSGIEYINIFRYETESQEANSKIKEDTVVNIGEIFIINKNKNTFSFTDRYTDSTKYYKYSIRYRNSKEYIFSELSNMPVKGKSTAANAEKAIILATGTSSVPVSLDEEMCILSIPANTFTMPETDRTNADNTVIKFDVMLAISNGTVTHLFKMIDDTANGQYTLPLRSSIPDHFYDTALTLQNIVGQYSEDASTTTGAKEPDYKRVYWTKPAEVQLKVNENDTLSFTVKAKLDSSNMMDYTPAANATSGDRSLSAADLSANTLYCDYN